MITPTRLTILSLLILGILIIPKISYAQTPGCAGPAYCAIHLKTRNSIKNYSDDAFEEYENDFVQGELARDYFTGALQYLTEQITVGDAEVTEGQASLSDATGMANRVNAQRTANVRQASALQTTDEMCERSTLTTSLTASAQQVIDAQARSSSEGSDEDLGKRGTLGAEGPGERVLSQIDRYVRIYANPSDFGGAIAEAYGVTPANPERIDKDIIPFFVDTYTLNCNLIDIQPSEVCEDVRALRLNLFGHNIPRIPLASATSSEAQNVRIDYSRVAQFQGLARRSFDSIVALRQEGNGEVAPYMRALLEQRGIAQPLIVESIMGENDKPSLMAQTKVLTQYLASGPDQADSTMAHSADLSRREVTNEALSLMVKFKIYESLKRQAAHFVAIHELKTDPLNDAVQRSF